jgi:hypothetical protein
MFGLISAGVSLAGLGMSVAQAIQAGKEAKTAQSTANMYANKFSNIQEQNAFAGVGVPTAGAEMATQQAQQALTSQMEALSGAGPEAVLGGASTAVQGNREAMAGISANLSDLEWQRDMAKANAQADINARRAEAERELVGSQYVMSMQDKNDQLQRRNEAIAGAFGIASTIPGLIAQDFDPDSGKYLYGKNKQGSDATGNSNYGYRPNNPGQGSGYSF